MLKMLAARPYRIGGMEASNCAVPLRVPDSANSGSVIFVKSHTENPTTIDNTAPILVARFQYKPAINGVNSDTRLNADDSPTNS